MKCILRVLFCVLAVVSALRADVLTLKGGTVIEGTVTEVGGLGMRIELVGGGAIFVLESDIERRDKQPADESFTRYGEGQEEGLQTRIRHYSRPGAAAVVSLVGVVHIGDPAYFQRIQAILDSHDLVLFEGVGGMDTAEVDFITKLQIEMKDYLGLEFQKDHLDYGGEHWINADMTWEEMREALEERGQELFPNMKAIKMLAPMITRMLESQKRFFDSSPEMKSMMQESLKRILGRMLANSDRLFEMLGIHDDKKRDDVIISLRNDRALSVLREHLKGKATSIAVFYGAAHHPDMDRGLREDLGFRPVGERWLTAWRVGESENARAR